MREGVLSPGVLKLVNVVTDGLRREEAMKDHEIRSKVTNILPLKKPTHAVNEVVGSFP
jgi:hypothetical protein